MEIPRDIPGLNFNPTGGELLVYLKQRILDYFSAGDPDYSTNRRLIPDIELNNWDPRELPCMYNRLSEARSNGSQWFFFCLRKEKYRKSSREERTVSNNVGYWKITSADKKVKSEDNREEAGKKKTLTFYRGCIASRRLTCWGMHEYHLNPSYLGYNVDEMPFVVCCVFKRSGKEDNGDDDESAVHEEVSSNHASSSGIQPPTYNNTDGLLGNNIVTQTAANDNSYADGAGSSFEGLLDCHQLCENDWFSKYY